MFAVVLALKEQTLPQVVESNAGEGLKATIMSNDSAHNRSIIGYNSKARSIRLTETTF